MSAAPRTALWGGRDGVGEEEGEGEKKEDPLRGGGRGRAREGGRGERDGILNGVLTPRVGQRRDAEETPETRRGGLNSGVPPYTLSSGGPWALLKTGESGGGKHQWGKGLRLEACGGVVKQ